MADNAHTDYSDAWSSLVDRRQDLIQQRQEPDADAFVIDTKKAVLDELLLTLPAPDLEAVLLKLHILWDGKFDIGDGIGDVEYHNKVKILDDIKRIDAGYSPSEWLQILADHYGVDLNEPDDNPDSQN